MAANAGARAEFPALEPQLTAVGLGQPLRLLLATAVRSRLAAAMQGDTPEFKLADWIVDRYASLGLTGYSCLAADLGARIAASSARREAHAALHGIAVAWMKEGGPGALAAPLPLSARAAGGLLLTFEGARLEALSQLLELESPSPPPPHRAAGGWGCEPDPPGSARRRRAGVPATVPWCLLLVLVCLEMTVLTSRPLA